MKSSIIPKEEAGKFRIESYLENISDLSPLGIEDKILELSQQISEEEKEKINKLLEVYFLRRNQRLELSRKFKDFFDEELKKTQKVSPSQKFVDFLISKKISGSHSRKKSSIIDNADLANIEPFLPANENETLQTEVPKIIKNEQGEITAIEVKCRCGEVIQIEIEFE